MSRSSPEVEQYYFFLLNQVPPADPCPITYPTSVFSDLPTACPYACILIQIEPNSVH